MVVGPVIAIRRSRAVLAALLLAACGEPPDGRPPLADTADPLTRLGAVAGTVRGGDGGAVAGARLVTTPHGYEGVTDAEGRFALRHLPPGAYELRIVARPFAPEVLEVRIEAGEEARADAVLGAEVPTGVVTVAVRGPDRQPLAGALVWTDDGVVATTGEDGVARLVGAGGRTVDVSVTDGPGRLHARTFRDVEVPARGGVQLAATLSGRPPESAFEIGSGVCLLCHPGHGSWRDGAHGRAFVAEPSADLAGAFARGESVDLGGPTARLTGSGSARQVVLTARSGEERALPVEAFVGDPRSGTVPTTASRGRSWPLPLGWVGRDPYREPWPEGVGRLVPWEVDRWFDEAGEFRFAAAATPPPDRSADAACLPCHVTGFDLAIGADGDVALHNSTGAGGRFASAGVGCERCHGPGSAHLDGGGDVWRIVRPDRLDPDRADDVCAQCHAATIGHGTGLPYPFARDAGLFRPGAALGDHASSDFRSWSSGAASHPNAQSDELAWSPHGEGSGSVGLRCFDCHDSHDASGHDASLRLGHRDNALCLGCHLGPTFGGEQAEVEAHARHLIAYTPDTFGIGRCTGCHMPRTASRLVVGHRSGAGDLASHLFAPLSPRWTLDVFDAAGATVLPLGAAPTHACAECHAYQAWRKEQVGWPMLGATGDPTLRSTHEAFRIQYDARFP